MRCFIITITGITGITVITAIKGMVEVMVAGTDTSINAGIVIAAVDITTRVGNTTITGNWR